MRWHPDVPDLPIKKPKEIENLEQMDRAVLDSMPPMEVEETVAQIAHAVARNYLKEKKDLATQPECLELISIALKVTGAAIGGHVGNAMVAEANSAAETACRLAFSSDQ